MLGGGLRIDSVAVRLEATCSQYLLFYAPDRRSRAWAVMRKSALRGGSLQLETERSDYPEDGSEFRVAVYGERLVEAFASQARLPRDGAHAPCASDVAEGGGDHRRVILMQSGREVGGSGFRCVEVVCRVPPGRPGSPLLFLSRHGS
jgi:hypothetical protein